MEEKIGIRVDANDSIAMGHLMRCIAIAEQLRKMEQAVVFIVSDACTKDSVTEKGFSCIALQNRYDEKDSETGVIRNIIATEHIKLLLLDSYEVTESYMRALRECVRLAYIDDLNKFRYPADVVINYKFGINVQEYEKWNYTDTEFLLGEAYTPLRPEFEQATIPVRKDVRRIFLTTGGTDEYDMILGILQELAQEKELDTVEKCIVVGKFYKNLAQLNELGSTRKDWKIYHDVSDICSRMRECDIAISAGGTTLAELAACGIPTVCFTIADNQQAGTKAYAAEGMVLFAGDVRENREGVIRTVIEKIRTLKEQREKREWLSSHANSRIDGKGAYRIAEKLRAGFSGRKAQIEWIKAVVALCLNPRDEITERKDFSALGMQYMGFTDEEKRAIWGIMDLQFEGKDELYLLSNLLRYTQIQDFWEKVACKIEQEDFDGFIGSMLEVQLVRSGKNFPYRQMRNIHRKNVDKLEKELDTCNCWIPIEKRNQKRIVIITEQLLNMNHAPTRMVRKILQILQEKFGYKVMVITCPSNYILPGYLWRNTYISNVDTDTDWMNVEKYSFPMADCNREKIREMLDRIHAFNPLFVLDMGVENPVASLPMKMTTVVSMELTGNCPVSDADILIRYQPKNAKQENEYKKEMKAYQQQLFMGEIFPVVVMQQRNKFERSQLGLPEDKFIVAVVGNRLDMEIDEEFADVLTRILMQNTKIDIVIIGEVHGIKEFFKYEEIFEQRIHCIGYCNELMETYGVMDLYLNPKRTGGGWSSVMAMSAGLPVVTLPECDVAYNVGEEFVVNSYEEVVDTVLRYAGDKQFYKNKRLAALELAKRNDEEKWEAYIKKMLDNIVILTAETVRI